MHRRRLSWFPRPPSPPWRAGPPPACRRRAARSTFSLVLPLLITRKTKYLSTRKGGQRGTLAASGAAHCHPAREAGAALLPWASVLTPEQASARTSAARSPHAASRSLRRSRPAGRSPSSASTRAPRCRVRPPETQIETTMLAGRLEPRRDAHARGILDSPGYSSPPPFRGSFVCGSVPPSWGVGVAIEMGDSHLGMEHALLAMISAGQGKATGPGHFVLC